MNPLQIRRGALPVLLLMAACAGGCSTCGEPQGPGTYGEESENEAMQEYEREQEMRDSDL